MTSSDKWKVRIKMGQEKKQKNKESFQAKFEVKSYNL